MSNPYDDVNEDYGEDDDDVNPISTSPRVRIVNPDPDLKMGMTGRVRIECGRQTVAARLAGALADFVRLDVRMQ